MIFHQFHQEEQKIREDRIFLHHSGNIQKEETLSDHAYGPR